MGSLRREGNFTVPHPRFPPPDFGLGPFGGRGRPGGLPPPFGPAMGPMGSLTSDVPPVFTSIDEDQSGELEGGELEGISRLSALFGATDTLYNTLLQKADNDGDGKLKPSEVKEL